MEGFLSTLPPYVHTFLDKHPATDVFNLLKELICFAVLYSEDRERIRNVTDELLKKDVENKKENNGETEVDEQETIVEDPKELIDATVPEKLKSQSTFPEWWGHQEFTPADKKPLKIARTPSIWETQEPESEQEKPQPWMPSLWECQEEEPVERKCSIETQKPSVLENNNVEPIETKQSSTWVSFDMDKKDTPRKYSNQVVIPNLRSYDETTSSKTPSKTVNKEEPEKKAKSVSRNESVKNTSKLVKEEGPSKPLRSSSTIKMPRQNAAVRARAEHAKLQQELLKKKPVSVSSPISQRLKQRASSGINWESIKQERRKTTSEK